MILVKPILPDSCLLPMYSYGERALVSLHLLLRTPVLLDRGFTLSLCLALSLITSLKTLVSKDSHVELGLQHNKFWEDTVQSIAAKMDAAAAKSLQSCPTLCNPIDGSPPVSPIPGILQARTLEWVAISFSSA